MKKKTYAFASALALAAIGAQAQTTAPATPAAPAAEAPKSDWTISGNAGLFSDYRFRGVSQTNKKPAFQGGFDIGHASGFYVGNWNSNVDSAYYNGANIEMDFYGGFKFPVGPVTLDGGVYYYYYPGSGDAPAGSNRIDNTELYIGASYQTYSLKYSYAVSDFFGVDDSKGSWYLDASGTYDLGNGFGLVGHLGYQKLKKNARVTEIGGSSPVDSITDWKLGATYDWNGWVFGAAYVSTNRDLTGGTALISNRNISNATAVLSVAKTF